MASEDFTGDDLLDRIQALLEQVSVPTDKGQKALKLYEDRLDLDQAPAQVMDTAFTAVIPSINNTGAQRPSGCLHVAERVEIRIARRLSTKKGSIDQRIERARARTILKAMITAGKKLEGYQVSYRSQVQTENRVSNLLLTTIIFEVSHFWTYGA